MGKVVVDTNVLVSGLRGGDGGACRAMFRAVILGRVQAVISGALFHEYRDVILGRDDLFKDSILESDREMILATFVDQCIFVDPRFLWRSNLKDEADNFLFDLAVAAMPSEIVTQDKAVLKGGELIFTTGVLCRTPKECLHERRLWHVGSASQTVSNG